MIDWSLYLVTDTALCGHRGVVRTVREAVDGGVTVVQVRDPAATGRELYELVVSVHEALRGTGVPLLVNDRLDVALAAGADGVHLGQSDLPVEAARAVLGQQRVLGHSVSTSEEVEAVPPEVDYLGVGPVVATPTKSDAADALGLDGLRDLTARTILPCVAIGGVHADNAAEIAATGVAGLCVVSEICAADDPRSAAATLRKVHQ
ncbi:thiamine phosphate synthase [Allosaccharopolyspora coralli]|uniref:Thiamine-phosphate synthase n=1 Tax=Allosaccharopolyspora coralli TaxID=2665642 RepID=A0A5Q3QBY6_9PSEU|nr:thiamine phosphate synthase [Allosaccharopolyspora coralli]QGK69109.1 thiamine phosphate synthase [Allosaccharopolyspora coralli]